MNVGSSIGVAQTHASVQAISPPPPPPVENKKDSEITEIKPTASANPRVGNNINLVA